MKVSELLKTKLMQSTQSEKRHNLLSWNIDSINIGYDILDNLIFRK